MAFGAEAAALPHKHHIHVSTQAHLEHENNKAATRKDYLNIGAKREPTLDCTAAPDGLAH